jgi:hypothetical protein
LRSQSLCNILSDEKMNCHLRICFAFRQAYVSHLQHVTENSSYCTTHKSSVSTGFTEQTMPVLRILCYNGNLVTWAVVRCTTAKFNFNQHWTTSTRYTARGGPHRKRLLHYCVFSRCRRSNASTELFPNKQPLYRRLYTQLPLGKGYSTCQNIFTHKFEAYILSTYMRFISYHRGTENYIPAEISNCRNYVQG